MGRRTVSRVLTLAALQTGEEIRSRGSCDTGDALQSPLIAMMAGCRTFHRRRRISIQGPSIVFDVASGGTNSKRLKVAAFGWFYFLAQTAVNERAFF